MGNWMCDLCAYMLDVHSWPDEDTEDMLLAMGVEADDVDLDDDVSTEESEESTALPPSSTEPSSSSPCASDWESLSGSPASKRPRRQ
jgi:hypothetical protein